MALATLTIDLIAQLAELQKGMDRGVAIAGGAAGRIEGKLNGLAAAAKGVGAAIGGALAVGGLTTLFRTTVDGIDALNDLADATGSSVENLSALEDAAKRTGTGVDVVGSALIKLNKTIADAKPGSDAAEALKAIGLSAQQLRDLDPAEALLRVAQGLASFSDDGNKARLTQELFGKSLREVAPLLKDLVEQGQLNATVTKEQAAEAEKLNHQFAQAKKNSEDLSRSLASALLPALNKLFERGKKEGLFAALFTPDEVGRLQQAAQQAQSDIERVGAALDRALTLSQRSDLSGGARAKWAAEAEALRAQLKSIQDQAVKTSDALRVATGGPSGALSDDPRRLLRRLEAASAERPSAPVIGGKADGPKQPSGAEFGPFLPPSLAAALKAIDEADERKVAALRAELGELTRIVSQGGDVPNSVFSKVVDEIAKLDPEARKAAEAAEKLKAIDEADERKVAALRAELGELTRIVSQGGDVPNSVFSKVVDEIAKLDPEARKAAEAAEKLKAAMDDGRRVFEATRTPSEQLAAEIEKLNGLLKLGAIDWDTYARATFDAQEAFDKSLKPAIEDVSEFAREASRNIQDSLGSSILASMEGSAKSIGDIWKNMLKRMVAEAAAAKLAESLLGKGYGSSTGQLGGFFGQAVKFFGSGGSSTSGSAPGGIDAGSAGGGGVQKSGAAVVQNVYVQGDVGVKARRAMLGVAAQVQARNQRQAAY